jgi:aspartate ammonia-lyase
MTTTRIEHDLLGPREVPGDALWGIHTLRARESFPLAGRPVHRELIHAFGAVKLACARANHELGRWDGPTMERIGAACEEMIRGELDGHVVVDALQGGAGTSTNMGVNEVLCNRALQLLGRAPGDYAVLHPLDDLNLHQSTNDTYPTALKVAAINLLRRLERAAVALQEAFQRKEREFAGVVKVGRTQMQDAVLTTLGREMSAYAEAFARDRWRVYKCEERLRVVNLGGTAIGTGVGAPRRFIFRATEHLRNITGIGLARADNLVEATQNADVFVEVSGILKACAVNLLKTSGDLRLLSSGPDAGLGEIHLPPRQAGSSIMPGKVNPVIPEAASQAALRVMGHDQVIAQACALGSLELNPFLPLVADCLLDSLDLLERSATMLRAHCVEGITADQARCARTVDGATATVTALVTAVGYERALEIARRARSEGRTVRAVAVDDGFVTGEQFAELTSPEAVTRLGWAEPATEVPGPPGPREGPGAGGAARRPGGEKIQ